MRNDVFTSTLGIQYPIIQAPMLGVTTPAMVAAASNCGALGSLPVGGLSPETTADLIQKTKSLTDKPFAVNLFVHDIPQFSLKEIAPMQQLLLQLAHKRGYKLEESDLSNFKFYTYRDQLEVLMRENISIISFTFGCPDQETIRQFKSRNCILIGTATCMEEAFFLEGQNIDMISIQGIEAGGHRGTFMNDIPLPQAGLFPLLQQICKTVNIPCIAAGGINSAETMKAAFDLGAAAVQIGTALIGTDESLAIDSYKQKLDTARDLDSTLTRAFSGRWARGLRNELMKEIEFSGILIPPYPVQNSMTAKFRQLAQQNNDSDYTNLWAGQSVALPSSKSTKEVLMDFVKRYRGLTS